jgi:hypothetical protein
MIITLYLIIYIKKYSRKKPDLMINKMIARIILNINKLKICPLVERPARRARLNNNLK